MSLTVTIPGRLPQLANGRLSWRPRYQLTKGIKERTWAQMITVRNEAGLPQATAPRTLRITVYVCGTLYDEGNLHANAKVHEDAAVAAGWLVDDAPEWCHLEVRQERVKTRIEQRIQIEVEDV